MHHGIKYKHIEINGIRTFYREAGAEHAPVVLLPHGYRRLLSNTAILYRPFPTGGVSSRRTFRASATATHRTGVTSPIRSMGTLIFWNSSRLR